MAAEQRRSRKSDQPALSLAGKRPADHDVGEGLPPGDHADELVAALELGAAEQRLHGLAAVWRVGAEGGGQRRMRGAESPLLVEGPQEAGFRGRRVAEIRRRWIVRSRSLAKLSAPGSQGRNRHKEQCRALRCGDAGAAESDAGRPPVDDKKHALETRRLADRQRRGQMAQAARARSFALNEPSFERDKIVGREKGERRRARDDDPRRRTDDRQARIVAAPVLRRLLRVEKRGGLLRQQVREVGGRRGVGHSRRSQDKSV